MSQPPGDLVLDVSFRVGIESEHGRHGPGESVTADARRMSWHPPGQCRRHGQAVAVAGNAQSVGGK
jgi:hypothetical protein